MVGGEMPGVVEIITRQASLRVAEYAFHYAKAAYGRATMSAIHKANVMQKTPTALLLSAVTVLCHLKLHDKAEPVQNGIVNTIAEGKYRTADVGGYSSTSDFTKAISDHL
ncbi:hypothetical protein ACOSP7_030813 [Xanthoceras sorbifolium]